MLPRRALVAIASTAVALVLLLNFRTPDQPASSLAGVVSAGSAAPVAQANPVGANGAGSGSSAGSQAASGGSSSSGAGSSGQATTGSAASYKAGTYTGPAVGTQFGDVQVQVTVSGGRITQVQALQLPTAHRRSADISQYAGPQLAHEALQAQSAQIDVVSGATYTSEAYAQSLQGALDQAHA